jgi:hypothetical protein
VFQFLRSDSDYHGYWSHTQGTLDEKKHIFVPNRYLREEFNISSSFKLVTTRESMAFLAKTLNDGLPFSVVTDV